MREGTQSIALNKRVTPSSVPLFGPSLEHQRLADHLRCSYHRNNGIAWQWAQRASMESVSLQYIAVRSMRWSCVSRKRHHCAP